MTSIPASAITDEGTGQQIGLKVQIAGDGSGDYLPVVTFGPDLIIGSVALDSALPDGLNTIGGIYLAPSSSASFAIIPGHSTSLEGSRILKANAGNLYSLYAITTNASGYLMTFNATSVPTDGPVMPVECIPVGENSYASINFAGAPPDRYTTGIIAVFSSTGPFTKTLSETVFFKWRVQ